MAGHVTCMKAQRNAYKILSRKSQGMRPFARLRCRLECINVDIKEMGCECVDWIHLALGRDQW
jgi:hypothetical protein